MRVFFGRVRAVGACGALAFVMVAGCGGSSEGAKEPELTADPPLTEGGQADTGAGATELQRGVAFIKEEKFAEAKPHLEKAVELDPRSTEAVFYLALSKEKLGDRAGAEEAYRGALKLDPKFTEAAGNLAALYLEEPVRPDDAIRVLTETLTKVPGNTTLIQNLAYAYGLKKDVEKASQQYEALIAKGGDNVQVRFAYGQLLLEAKQKDRAAEQLRKALEGAEKDAPMLVTLGRLLGAAGAYGDCVKAFDKALALKAEDPEWFVRRGTCRHELKDEPGAREDYEAALKRNPQFAPAHYYLGMSWLAEKKIPNAKIELAKAAKLGEGTEIGKRAQQKLDELPAK